MIQTSPNYRVLCHFATHDAIRAQRPFSYYPSRNAGLIPVPKLNPGAYTGFTLGGHTK